MDPFTEIDVLDLTHSLAGPTATQLLGALGATVVKVEPPTGDPFRNLLNGSFFSAVNMGGKQSISIDLKTAKGQEIARDLARSADIVIESYRPGTLEQFGLDYETVSGENKDVVYCSVTGFGQDGPRSNWPGYDPIIQSASGLMSTTGYTDRPPVRIGASVIDCASGMTAAFSIVSALYNRRDQGKGTHIDISLFDVGVSWMGYWIANYSATGETPRQSGQGFAGLAPNAVYHAAGGDQFYLACANDTHFQRLCAKLDREELLTDERFAQSEQRWTNRDELRAELVQTFEQYELQDLVETLTDAGVPAGPLQTIDEIVDEDDHVEARNLLTETYNHAREQTVKTAHLPFKTSAGRPDPSASPPALGEHTRSILSEQGYSIEEIDQMITNNVVRES